MTICICTVASERNQYCEGEASSKPEGLSSLIRQGEQGVNLLKIVGRGGRVSKTLEWKRHADGSGVTHPSPVVVGSGLQKKNVRLCPSKC